MERDGSGVSALVGLDGFAVCAQVLDDASGEWWLAVETTFAMGSRTHNRRTLARDLSSRSEYAHDEDGR